MERKIFSKKTNFNDLKIIASEDESDNILFADFSYIHTENGKGKEYWNSEDLYKQIRKNFNLI